MDNYRITLRYFRRLNEEDPTPLFELDQEEFAVDSNGEVTITGTSQAIDGMVYRVIPSTWITDEEYTEINSNNYLDFDEEVLRDSFISLRSEKPLSVPLQFHPDIYDAKVNETSLELGLIEYRYFMQ